MTLRRVISVIVPPSVRNFGRDGTTHGPANVNAFTWQQTGFLTPRRADFGGYC